MIETGVKKIKKVGEKMKNIFKILILLLIAVFLIGTILAAQNKFVFRLDTIMTSEEQKKTGIIKLTDSEREALEVWLTNWTLKTMARSKSNTRSINLSGKDRHWILNKIDNGKYIKLEDNSLWEIASLDLINTNLWLVTDDIIVIESDNPIYPYKLINTDEDESAEAKQISR